EPIDHAESETTALADVLGGEERLEYARHHLGRHADAAVGDGKHDIFAGFHPVCRRIAIPDLDIGGRDDETAAVAHCVACVDGEADDCVLHLRAVDSCRPQAITGAE